MPEYFGMVLASARKAQKKSQRRVEAETGIDDAIIARLERGSYRFKSRIILTEKLLKYYGIKIDEVTQ